MRRFLSVAFLLITAASPFVFAQEKARENGPDPATAREIVEKQFGPGFTRLADVPAIVADFDGDRVADLALAAKASNPLLNAVEYNYKVIDPYHSFYGFGNPAVTLQFEVEDPRQKGTVVLIIHGANDGDWSAAAPKAKFVVVNFPYTRLTHTQVLLHKKPVGAIAAEETDTVSSVIYWDGKKYRYRPNGAASN